MGNFKKKELKKGSICAIIVIDAPDRQMIPEKIIDIDLRIAIAKSMLWLKYHVLFTPIVSDSYFFLNRFSVFSPRRCSICFLLHGTVITRESYQDYVRTYNSKKEKYYSDTSSCFYEHDFCHCYFKCMRQILPGTATIHGILGADYSLAVSKKLPDYYISKKEARKTDWMSTVISAITATPSKMIGGDIFQNNENKLPAKEGRIWHEADINYVIGRRGNHRILYSNDGLIFVTYDHYRTFFLIPTFN